MWDAEKAIEHLDSNAKTKSVGACARYVREAIEAGGVTLIRQHSAKNYGASLLNVGFLKIATTCSDTGIEYAAGDVVVIGAFDEHVHGHIAMYNGKSWISDFKQKGIYPGPAYRKAKPACAIYRYQ